MEIYCDVYIKVVVFSLKHFNRIAHSKGEPDELYYGETRKRHVHS